MTMNRKYFDSRHDTLRDQIVQRATALAPQCNPPMTICGFLRSPSGMAMCFEELNSIFGDYFEVDGQEVTDQTLAGQRRQNLASQFVFDAHVHHFYEGHQGYDADRGEFFEPHWWWDHRSSKPWPTDRPFTDEHYKFKLFTRYLYFDSDTKAALLSTSPTNNANRRLLNSAEMAASRDRVNGWLGADRLYCHAPIWPSRYGARQANDALLDKALDEMSTDARDYRNLAWKGYTIGDPIDSRNRLPWCLDQDIADEAFQRALDLGIPVVCIHKGSDQRGANWGPLNPGSTVDDLEAAARKHPNISFVIYHSALKSELATIPQSAQYRTQNKRMEWVDELAAIMGRNPNVYAEIGLSFGQLVLFDPEMCAAMLAKLGATAGPKGGPGWSRIIWGTDSVWFGPPQWEIEALRRLILPQWMQQRWGCPELGDALGAAKSGILGENAFALFGVGPPTLTPYFSQIRRRYQELRETDAITGDHSADRFFDAEYQKAFP